MENSIELELARFAAFTVGDFIKSESYKNKNISYKTSNTDLVTNIDKAAEKIIRKLILNTFPTHSILGEEEVSPGAEASAYALKEKINNEHLWIIDPIDGTTNFIHSFPYFCVSIAYVEKKDIRLGVIYNPMTNEMFMAEKGKGATLNGEPIKVAEEIDLDKSLVSTAIPKSDLGIKLLLAIHSKVRGIRSPGAAALQLAYVAAGRLSAFWEKDLNAWDIAAGALILSEAGGCISDMNGNTYTLETRNILGTNSLSHTKMLEIMEEFVYE